MKLSSHPYLVESIRIHGAVSPHPHTHSWLGAKEKKLLRISFTKSPELIRFRSEDDIKMDHKYCSIAQCINLAQGRIQW
jgi:hypothetical protein